MQGLANPTDILNSFRTAQRLEEQEKKFSTMNGGMGSGANIENGNNPSFESVLSSIDFDLLRPDRGLLDVMDSNYEATDRRERNETGFSSLPFDSVIKAQVAGAVGHLYSGGEYLDPTSGKLTALLRKESPFSPATSLSNIGPTMPSFSMTPPDSDAANKDSKDNKEGAAEPEQTAEDFLTGMLANMTSSFASSVSRSSTGTYHPALAKAMGFYELTSARIP